MATVETVLSLARSQLGVCENPMGSNSGTPYHAWFGAFSQGWQWCAIFVAWVFWHVDPNLINRVRSAYSGDYFGAGKRVDKPLPGDIVIFDYFNGGITDHIGIVESVEQRGITCVEGNHNDRVERVKREFGSAVMWFIRPAYDNAKPEPKEEVDKVSVWTSGEPITEAACPCYVGVVPGGTREEDGWAKVLNLSDKPAKVRVLAITNNVIKDKVIEVQTNKQAEVSARSLGATGPTWLHVYGDRPVFIGFDVRA